MAAKMPSMRTVVVIAVISLIALAVALRVPQVRALVFGTNTK